MAKKLIYEVGVGVRLIPVSSLETGFRKGDLQVLDSDSKLYFDNGTAHLAVVTETGSATLTGKTYSAVNGSAASPSFRFDNSPTTGLFRSSADVIGLAIAGTERASVSATTLLMRGGIESGVASSASGSMSIFTSAGSNSFSVSMASASEARLIVSGASAMSFYTNSNERLALSSAGVATFSNVLRANSGTKTAPTYSFSSETDTGFYLIGSANVGLSLLDTIRYDFSPSYLSYYGASSAIDTTPGNGSATLALAKNATSGEGALISYSSGGSNYLSLYTNTGGAAATEKVRVTSSGDAEVRGGALVVYHSALGANTLTFSKPSTSESRITSVGSTSLTFYTNGDERLVIDSSGNVKMKAQLQIEDPGVGTNQVNIQSPSGLASSYTLTLPVDDGTPNQFLITDGSGNLSWTSTVAGSGLYSFSGTYVAPNSLAAAATLTSGADSRRISYVIGSGGPVTLSSTTPVSAGTSSGQELVIIGTSDINTVTVPMSGNVILKAACVLGQYDSVSLAWDAVSSVWIEIGRNF